jgi:hypothetical protein
MSACAAVSWRVCTIAIQLKLTVVPNCVMVCVNNSNHPIQNPLLFVTGPRTRENIIHYVDFTLIDLFRTQFPVFVFSLLVLISLGLFFHHEDRGNRFLRNVSNYLWGCMAAHTRRLRILNRTVKTSYVRESIWMNEWIRTEGKMIEKNGEGMKIVKGVNQRVLKCVKE